MAYLFSLSPGSSQECPLFSLFGKPEAKLHYFQEMKHRLDE